jgi:hypothetical protein
LRSGWTQAGMSVPEVLGRRVGGVVVVLVDDFWTPLEAGGGVDDIAAGGDMVAGNFFRQ